VALPGGQPSLAVVRTYYTSDISPTLIQTSSRTVTQPAIPQNLQTASTQSLTGRIYRFFHPQTLFLIKARGLHVYILWNRTPTIPDSFYRPPSEILQSKERLGSWYAIHLIWKPTSNTAETPWLDTPETMQAFPVMLDYLDRLAAVQLTNNPDKTQLAQPVFQILHIRELKVLIPHFYRLRAYRLRQHKSMEKLQQEILYTRRAFVDELQENFHLLGEDTQDGLSVSAFDHYDRDLHSRGWIIINPSRALLVGVNDKAAPILANLLQRRDIDQSGQSISPDHYEDMLGRLGLWNSTQEIGETIDQLEIMVTKGRKSTDGQILLSLVLALIGTVLALYSILQSKNWEQQLWISLWLLFLTSLFFWFYARFNTIIPQKSCSSPDYFKRLRSRSPLLSILLDNLDEQDTPNYWLSMLIPKPLPLFSRYNLYSSLRS